MTCATGVLFSTCCFLLIVRLADSEGSDSSRYLQERVQFGAPLASFQLNQEKLVRMLGNVQAMFLMGWRLCQLYESDRMTPGQASLVKVDSDSSPLINGYYL